MELSGSALKKWNWSGLRFSAKPNKKTHVIDGVTASGLGASPASRSDSIERFRV